MENDFVNSFRRSDASENFEKIIEAAITIFSTKGIEATINEVAIEANVGVGSVYRRFSNKQQLIHAVSYEALKDLYREQEEFLILDLPVDEMLIRVFSCYTKLSSEYGEINQIILDILVSNNPVHQEFKDNILSTVNQIYEVIIDKGIHSGVFHNENAELLKVFLSNTISPQVIKQLTDITTLENIPVLLANLALNGILKK